MVDLRKKYEEFAPIHQSKNGVGSVDDFSRVLGNYQSSCSDFRNVIFRGENELFDSKNSRYDTFLIPKIARLAVEKGTGLTPYKKGIANSFGQLNITNEEIDELIGFRKNSPRTDLLPNAASWIPLAQHYGAKTRLLDFTRNPLVALFFACWNSRAASISKDDGVVFMVLPDTLRPQTLDRANVKQGDIEQGIPQSMFELFECWPLSDVNEHTGHMLIPLHNEYALNNRLRAQDGLFVWWNPPYKHMRENTVNWYFPIIVRGGNKHGILKCLGSLGICPYRLFPDDEGLKYQASLDKALA